VDKSLLHIIDNAKNFVIKGRVDKAIDILVDKSHLFSSDSQRIIYLISCRYNSFNRDQFLGLTNNKTIITQIADSILNFLENLKKDLSFLKKHQ